MPRPKTKQELLTAASENRQRLLSMLDVMTDAERNTPFDFSADAKKTEAHWSRDRNVRDVLTHLYEWHRLLLRWVDANLHGESVPFLPEPYTWKTYGEMNMGFWRKHQATDLETARTLFEQSHADVIALLERFSDEELFTKGAYPWTGGTTLGSYFISATSSHYDWAMKKLKAHKKIVFPR